MTWAGCLSFDTETTGTDPYTARVVSAALLFLGTGGQGSQEWLVNPGVEIPEEATKIHGITNAMVEADGYETAVFVHAVIWAIEDGIAEGLPLVIYNAPYDLTVLRTEATRCEVTWTLDKVKVIDPLVIDKHLDPYRRGSRKLVDVAKLYNVPEEGAAHGARADALMAARLAYRLFQRPEIGNLSLDQLHDAQVSWRAEQAASFEDYLTRQGRPEKIAREWPILPLTE
jgi:DNA polymerase-3 subunit epsilon